MSTRADEWPVWRPTFAEIDLRAFDRNVDSILGTIPGGSRMIAVLKANAYGHGALALAKRCESRAAAIAVALLEEGLELRSGGIRIPILVLGPLRGEQFGLAFEHGLTPGIIGPEELAAFSARARATGWTGEIHLKLDTGMGRMGFLPEDLDGIVRELRGVPGVRVGAIYTHFANASDPEDPFTERQLEQFEAMTARLRELGVAAPHHVANSAAIVRRIVRPGDAVRAGIVLYGGEPLDPGGARLEPVLRWVTRVARLKTVPPGASVGYGRTFIASRPTRIATIPVGYADGYHRRLSSGGEVLIRGRRAPIAGQISMDLITVDVTELSEAAAGDEVVLIGRSGGQEISAEELAGKLGTISYEVLCAVSERVPRVYVDGEERWIDSKFARTLSP